jgi:hypothetical protein
MGRLLAGIVAGCACAGPLLVLTYAFNQPFGLLAPVAALVAGAIAGVIVARNPDFAGKSAAAGLAAGAVAGGLLLATAVAGAFIYLNMPQTQTRFAERQQTAVAQATASASDASATPEPATAPSVVDANSYDEATLYTFSIALGIIGLPLALGAGTIAGALAGQRSV